VLPKGLHLNGAAGKTPRVWRQGRHKQEILARFAASEKPRRRIAGHASGHLCLDAACTRCASEAF
jgi:hypothetical protein